MDHEHVYETLDDGSRLCFECDHRMPAPPLFKYRFRLKGRLADGTKIVMEGHVFDVDGTPWSGFDKALECCRKSSPGLIVDQAKPGWCVLTKNKRPHARIALVREPKEFDHYPLEQCCFCLVPTKTWVAGKDVACCQSCATTHSLDEVPTKAKWCARLKSPV